MLEGYLPLYCSISQQYTREAYPPRCEQALLRARNNSLISSASLIAIAVLSLSDIFTRAGPWCLCLLSPGMLWCVAVSACSGEHLAVLACCSIIATSNNNIYRSMLIRPCLPSAKHRRPRRRRQTLIPHDPRQQRTKKVQVAHVWLQPGAGAVLDSRAQHTQ